MKIEIEQTLQPANMDIQYLTDRINEETPQFGPAYPFAFYIRDDNQNIIAGCNGSVVFGAIYTDQLWVHRDHRKEGYGKMLMDHIHELAKKQGCRIATVATMNFQNAKAFYEKLGYVVDHERHGYTMDSSMIYLIKKI